MADVEPAKGHSRHSGFVRDALDWYVEPPFVVEQLLDHEDFSGHLIWDPACGGGTIPAVCGARGLTAVGSDVVHRGGDRSHWFQLDFLKEEPLLVGDLPYAIISNPPYGRLQPGMPRGDTYAERFARRALATGAAKVALVLNGKFLWSERRWRLFHEDHPPTQILFCSDRPSMPPGAELPRLRAEGRAFEGGAIDYIWLLWVAGAAPRPPAWLRPASASPAKRVDQASAPS